MSTVKIDFASGTGNFAAGAGNFNAADREAPRKDVKILTGKRIVLRVLE